MLPGVGSNKGSGIEVTSCANSLGLIDIWWSINPSIRDYILWGGFWLGMKPFRESIYFLYLLSNVLFIFASDSPIRPQDVFVLLLWCVLTHPYWKIVTINLNSFKIEFLSFSFSFLFLHLMLGLCMTSGYYGMLLKAFIRSNTIWFCSIICMVNSLISKSKSWGRRQKFGLFSQNRLP